MSSSRCPLPHLPSVLYFLHSISSSSLLVAVSGSPYSIGLLIVFYCYFFFLYLNWNLWLSFVFFFSWLMAGWSSFATVHSIVCYLCCFYVKCIPAFLNGYYNYIDYKMHSLDSHSFRMFFQFKVSFSKLYISHENFRHVLYKFYLIEFLFIGIDLVFLWLPKKAWFNFTRFKFNGFLSSSSDCTILRSLFLKKNIRHLGIYIIVYIFYTCIFWMEPLLSVEYFPLPLPVHSITWISLK